MCVPVWSVDEEQKAGRFSRLAGSLHSFGQGQTLVTTPSTACNFQLAAKLHSRFVFVDRTALKHSQYPLWDTLNEIDASLLKSPQSRTAESDWDWPAFLKLSLEHTL